jgi:hypothetical protein
MSSPRMRCFIVGYRAPRDCDYSDALLAGILCELLQISQPDNCQTGKAYNHCEEPHGGCRERAVGSAL